MGLGFLLLAMVMITIIGVSVIPANMTLAVTVTVSLPLLSPLRLLVLIAILVSLFCCFSLASILLILASSTLASLRRGSRPLRRGIRNPSPQSPSLSHPTQVRNPKP